jgi:NAD(P)-dependent dehydrogenase (short-subunit alcohol dehydrogenase family)
MVPRTALVVAASSEIGFGVAQRLLADGFDVAAHCHTNRPRLEHLTSKASAWGRALAVIEVDLTTPGGAERLVDEALGVLHGLDVLVNTIGPFEEVDLLATTPEIWRRILELNLNVVFDIIHYATASLVARRGHIVNFAFGGVDQLRSRPKATAFTAAKLGVVALTKALAVRLAPRGVRVNAVCPGFIDDNDYAEERLRQILDEIPAGRLGRVEEVADVVSWLVGESPSYVTGAHIPVAGGWDY